MTEQKQTRWVKCSERLPTSCKDVPVLVEADGRPTLEVGYVVYGRWKEIHCRTNLLNVVAWLENMPEYVS